MDERQREDRIQGVTAAIEKNGCAIKREDLYKKFKNTDRDNLKSTIETMKRRGMLKYDIDRDKYRLIL
ncbi:hypothetical protein [Methanosarcina mazei]|uniref:Uncharacterized protein n=1 Tax=Methanosarcina mazei TaxID=2209 RepID=A0A0F8HH99_METMZ|nr:hypothetical protein [Methanosarcina mazei]KKG49250.1 hypothetical protein DU33_16220 [Methanosarcina mazei]KKG62249.1 hypothetical protein DU45_19160 [Methanosarcina mazei]KKG66194.1 hypothetical protein DU64_15360 [Methanosarcina mazei]